MNWIIVPVRSGLDFTKAAVETFLAQDVRNVSVYIVDNDTSRAHNDWHLSQGPASRHIWMLANFGQSRGVAESWNAALDQIWQWGEDHAFVINNDVLLRPDCLRHLLADGGGFVTAVGVTEREKILPRERHLGSEFTLEDWEVIRGTTAVGYPPPDPAAKRPHPDFSCFLIRKWVYEKVGPFDEKFLGGYCEDADYHCRMHRKGVEAYSIDLPFLHHASGTIKTSSALEAEGIQQQANRNRDYFQSKWGFRIGSPEYYAFFSPENFGVDA